MIWLAPFLLLLTFELIADVFAKQWSISNKPILWVAAILAYVLGNVFWLFALKNGAGLARGTVLFSIASEILTIMVGVLYFREHLTTIQTAGIILGIISLVLIFWE